MINFATVLWKVLCVRKPATGERTHKNKGFSFKIKGNPLFIYMQQIGGLIKRFSFNLILPASLGSPEEHHARLVGLEPPVRRPGNRFGRRDVVPLF